MADSANDNPSRSQADKERSRQQSRSVDARNAGRTGSSRPPKGGTAAAGRGTKGGDAGGTGKGAGNGKGTGTGTGTSTSTGTGTGTGTGKGTSTPGKGAGARSQGGQRGSGARTTAPGRPGRPVRRPVASGGSRSATALLTWGIVAVVLVVVIVLVAVKVFGGSSTSSSNAVQAGPVPSSVVTAVTHVPASVFDAVGTSSSAVTVNPPRIEKNQPPYTVNGKPVYFFMGGEYCPYCAAERWAVVAALSRFGTISGLQTMSSAATDFAPNTQTFTFAGAKYTSPYITAILREVYSNQKTSTGRAYKTLQKLTKQQTKLVGRYDVTPSTASAGGRSIPFSDIDNKVIFSGASYSPMILQGLTREQIASDLSDPKNVVTQAIITTANYISAGVCSVDGGQPGSVCNSKGVQAAAKALGLSI